MADEEAVPGAAADRSGAQAGAAAATESEPGAGMAASAEEMPGRGAADEGAMQEPRPSGAIDGPPATLPPPPMPASALALGVRSTVVLKP